MDRPACRNSGGVLLYHEMLHVKHPTRRSGCSLVSHSREFARREAVCGIRRARRVLDVWRANTSSFLGLFAQLVDFLRIYRHLRRADIVRDIANRCNSLFLQPFFLLSLT